MAAVVIPPSVRTSRSVAVVRAEETRTVVVMRGEWDLSTQATIAEVLTRVIADTTGDVVIDLAQADFIDTATVHTFLDAQRALDRCGRRLGFISPSSLAARVLELFGLSDRIDRREQAGP